MKPTAKRNTFYFTLIPLTLGIVILSQVLFSQGCDAPAPPEIPALAVERLTEYKAFLSGRGQPPADLVAQAFEDHDLVFMGEYYNNVMISGFKQNVAPIRTCIGPMFAKGVRVLGLGFIYAEDQAKVDAFLAAPEFLESSLYDLLINDYGINGYTEYAEILKAAWTFNHGLANGETPLRLIGLGLKLDYHKIKAVADFEDPVKMKNALGGITPEQFITDILEREVMSPKAKALLFLPVEFCVKDFPLKRQGDYYKRMELAYAGSPALILGKKYPGRVFVLLEHNLWAQDSKQSYSLPAAGHIDATIRAMVSPYVNIAFAVTGSPWADIPVTDSLADADGGPVSLARLCDAYMINGPLADYAISPFPENAITIDNFSAIKARFGLDEQTARDLTPKIFVDRINQSIQAGNKMMSQLPR